MPSIGPIMRFPLRGVSVPASQRRLHSQLPPFFLKKDLCQAFSQIVIMIWFSGILGKKKKKKKKVLAHDLQLFYSIFFQMSHHHGSHGSRSVNCGTFPGKTKKKKVGCARGSRYAPTDYRRFLTILLGFFLTKTTSECFCTHM